MLATSYMSVTRPLMVAAYRAHETELEDAFVRDPLAARLRALADQAGPVASRLAPALLSVREVFGTDLATDPRFASSIETALDRLFTRGARETVAALAHQAPD